MVEFNPLIIGMIVAGIGVVIFAIILIISLRKKPKEKPPAKGVKPIPKKGIPIPKKEEKALFKIEAPEIPELPEPVDITKVDIRYPLIPPYTSAHIYWDAPNTELVYQIEEPELTDKEKKVLATVEEGIKELINLSYISVKDMETVLLYLEKNVKVLLSELSIKIPMSSFLKIMYYIYRNFVGLNELEPLMNDYFIEDVECNGLNTPVYIVHRKYRNIRTSLIYTDIHKAASFIEKLAQKCGKYVSYAEPLLDGTLPDQSRVNATYTTDITTRGPTFSIRKFTKEPWSPIQLMQKGTVSAEQLAYAWMCLEYENSLMVIGGTGSGKCVTGDTPIHLSNGSLIKIKDIIETKFKNSKIYNDDGWEYVEGDGTEVLSMDKDSLKVIKTKITKYWRHKAPKTLIKIKTRSGREIITTPEHPFFTLNQGNLSKIRADKITTENRIAVPRNPKLNSDIFWDEIESIKILNDHKEGYVYDLTIDKHHNFLAGDIPIVTHNTTLLNVFAFFLPPQARVVSIEDTRELTLEHENWLPSVARAGVGLTNILGEKYGEVSLFDLLKASFRQRPDYIIVGEVRGKEAFVLFQAYASVRGNEEIMLLNDDHPKRVKIKDMNPLTKYKAITFDEKGNAKIIPVRAQIKHPARKELYKITTKTGRQVTITPDHSVFSYEGKIKEITVNKIKKGSKIIIPAKIPSGYADIKKINLLNTLKGIRVFAPEYIKVASRKFGYYEASELCGIVSVSDYYANFTKKKPNAMLADKFKKLMKEANIDYDINKLKVRFRGSKILNANLHLSNELLKLIGYYIAEGNINHSGRNSSINLYNGDPKILNDMRRIIEKLNDKPPKERDCDRGFGYSLELNFSHRVLLELLVQTCGEKTEKRIPDFIFGLSKERIGTFLTPLFEGDGSLNKDEFAYYTTSKKLANDITQLLMVYGIVARVTSRQREGRKTTDYEIMIYRTDQRKELLKYLKPVSKKIKLTKISPKNHSFVNDIYIDKIKTIEKIKLDKPEPVYDISVPGTQNFVGGFGGILLHNSGHPGMATMHAENVPTMIRRLETPPINLSGSLIETLATVFVISQSRVKGKEVRRLSSIDEIVEVREAAAGGGEVLNNVFKWNPANDTFTFNPNSRVFNNIATHYGYTPEQVMTEFRLRNALLKELFRRRIIGFKEVQKVIHEYFKSPKTVLKKYGIRV